MLEKLCWNMHVSHEGKWFRACGWHVSPALLGHCGMQGGRADAGAACGHRAAAGQGRWHVLPLWITLLGSAPAWQAQLKIVCPGISEAILATLPLSAETDLVQRGGSGEARVPTEEAVCFGSSAGSWSQDSERPAPAFLPAAFPALGRCQASCCSTTFPSKCHALGKLEAASHCVAVSS